MRDTPPATIDVHTHVFPAGLGDLAARTGDGRWPSLAIDEHGQARIMRGASVFRPVARTCWDATARLAAMDAAGIDVQVLSPVPITLTTWADAQLAADFARAQNDAIAAVAAAAPDRFRWFASVPLQDVELAVGELQRVRRELRADGVQIGTEVHGRELDHAALRPFFRAAAELGLAVFVHPTDGVGAIRRGGQPYEFGLGMLTDTAMAAAALVFGGVLDELPSLRVGLAHGCGSFPWAYPRLARGATLGAAGAAVDLPRTDALVRRLWADTLVFDPAHLPLLVQRFGADHLMVGSDFPFYPPAWGGPLDILHAAVAERFCTEEQTTAMRAANALAFLGAAASAAAPADEHTEADGHR